MSDRDVEVLCIGESMAVLAPASEADALRLHVGGAESNTALHLAAQRVRAGWASRLGDDLFGHRILTELSAGGVDVSQVAVDPRAPTGAYLKEARETGTRTTYYRRGSAASHLSAAFVDELTLPRGGWVHVSGITAALSPTAAAALDAVFAAAHRVAARVSFDVNHRPALWGGADAPGELRRLALNADLVLVGRDEGEALWGTRTADDIAAYLPDSPLLVVKDGAVEAVEFDRRGGGRRTRMATPATEVVEPVGAGDAFAGGYLAGLLRGEDARARLLRGHRAAAWTLGSVLDVRPGHRPSPFQTATDPIGRTR